MNLTIEKSIEPTGRGPVCSVCCKPHDKDNPVGYFYPPANALDSWEQAAACDDPDAEPLYAAPVQQAEQRSDSERMEMVALLQLAEDALVYHTEQTRPIQNTIDALAAIQKFKEKQR